MSLRFLSKIGPVAPRQIVGRRLPQTAVCQRGVFYTQDKRGSTREEVGILVLGLGLLSSSVIWAIKEGAFTLHMTPDEVAKVDGTLISIFSKAATPLPNPLKCN